VPSGERLPDVVFDIASTAGLTLLGFVLGRTTGLPNFRDDIGNWTEPLGLASIFTEGVTVLLGADKVATTPRIERGGLTTAVVGAEQSFSRAL
jgi:hypothetical protein